MGTKAWTEANQDVMRKARRDWYERNRENQIAVSRANKKLYVERNVAITVDRRAVPCADCNVQYPYYVMQFDHISDDKTGAICKMARTPVSEKKLLAEIEKCEVVCANCHAIRTHERRVMGVTVG